MVSLLATAAQGFAAHCAGHETRCINSRTEGLLDREVLTMPTREMLVHLRNRTLARLQLQPNSTVNYEWMMRTYRQGMHWSKQGLTPGYCASPRSRSDLAPLLTNTSTGRRLSRRGSRGRWRLPVRTHLAGAGGQRP